MPARAEHERAFHRAGLPSFIAQRTAREDIWTRAVPVLGLAFFLEVLGAVDELRPEQAAAIAAWHATHAA